MKLISMTDFVLERKRPTPSADLHELDYYHEEYLVLERISNYARFLKQPLKLEMFVTCDEDGNVLEYKPNEDKHKDAGSFMAYNGAKEKVLFEGFRILDNEDKVFCTLGRGKLIITYDYKTKTFLLQKDWTVERLVRLSLILTPTAIKQIEP